LVDAKRRDQHHRVFEGLPRHDVTRLQIGFEDPVHQETGIAASWRFFGFGRRRAAWQTHAERLNGRSHRVRRHTAAGPAPGDEIRCRCRSSIAPDSNCP
jgi:hypothetical protein